MLEKLKPVVRGVTLQWSRGVPMDPNAISWLLQPYHPAFSDIRLKKKKKKTRLALRCNCVRVPMDLAVDHQWEDTQQKLFSTYKWPLTSGGYNKCRSVTYLTIIWVMVWVCGNVCKRLPQFWSKRRKMHKKGREKPEEGSKLSSKSVNGLRQKVQKTGIFELFWPLMSIWRMRNELHKYKQLLRYQGSRVLQ